MAGPLKKGEQAVRTPDRVEEVIAKVRGVAVDAGASPQVVERTHRELVAARFHRFGGTFWRRRRALMRYFPLSANSTHR